MGATKLRRTTHAKLFQSEVTTLTIIGRSSAYLTLDELKNEHLLRTPGDPRGGDENTQRLFGLQ
jgi:hypothetical protein